MRAGIKTSELWVVLLLIGSQALTTAGIDVTGLTEAQVQVAELAKQIQAQAGVDGIGPTWIALAYVVGRLALKWKDLGRETPDV